MAIRKARIRVNISATFGPEANDFGLLEQTLSTMVANGKGQSRKYLHTYDEAVPWNRCRGPYPGSRCRSRQTCCSGEGLHGGVVTPQHDVASHVDLLVGVVPIVNLEDPKAYSRHQRTRHLEAVATWSSARWKITSTNTPQFSRTHINFQRVPTRTPPTRLPPKRSSLDESFVVIHFRNLQNIDCCWRCCRARLSRNTKFTLVVPGGKWGRRWMHHDAAGRALDVGRKIGWTKNPGLAGG